MNNHNSLNNKGTINTNNKIEYNNKSNNNNQKTSNRCISSYDKTLQQSPKISTSKHRPLSSRPKPFSLLDVDDKKNISKGPNIPAQHKRINEEQLSKLIGNINERAGNNYGKKMIINNFLNKYKKKNDSNSNFKNNNENIIDNNNQYNINKLKANKKLTIDTKETYNIDNINKKKQIDKNKQGIKKEIQNNKTITNGSLKRPLSVQIRQKKDRWLPKGYPYYEYCVLNPKCNKENFEENPFLKNESIQNANSIKKNSNESDIFFLGPQTEKETKLLVIDNNKRAQNYNIKLGSDIFNLKKDFTNLMKSSETYLFKNNNYPISSESKSFWTPRANIPTYMNCPSVEYNILNPKAKCNTKTKEQIYNECKQKKNDDSKNIINYMNPIFRQKNISNFYDITKGGMNRNFTYEKIYQDNPRNYFRKNNLCTLQYDLYSNYRGIIDRPFRAQISNKIQI